MTSSWSPIRTVRLSLESRVMPRTPRVTIRGDRIHAIQVLTPRRASRSMIARAIVVFPAPSGPTIAYTLAAQECCDPLVAARSFDAWRSLRARFDFIGRLPSGFGRSFKTVPEIHSTIGETSTTRGNTSRGLSGSSCLGTAALGNVKVIRLRPLFLLPAGRGEDFPVEHQTSRRMRSLEGHHLDRHTRPHDAVTGGTD